MAEGIIVKALSGFYYVENEAGYFQCRGRGLFRKQKIKPLVGDKVKFDAENVTDGYILEIKERSNELVRPPVANIDQALLVFSAEEPSFSTILLDRFLVHVEAQQIRIRIIITKMDLADEEKKEEIIQYKKDYEEAGYEVILLSSVTNEGVEALRPVFAANLSIIAGQSGVGKSTLLNALKPDLDLETAEISSHLGRGKHTTRHVELLKIDGGLVADTPGFSSLDFKEIQEDNLDLYFPEMKRRLPECKFRGCTHRREPGCAIKQALKTGELKEYRYKHYLQFFQEISEQRRY
ncbi:ribosome small subunit-dependent GTPase A [Alteribacillus sp. HJP-4]|uniref:ribosome small subunit-dependent GTPase A n=1 Tax=Alteribacillus sp. HJP-4 TaxID=2775394 RepID=UPI0035CCF7E9